MDSSSSIIPFASEEFGTIRTVEQNGKIMFCGKDVAAALGYANPNKALRDHTRGDRFVHPLETNGGVQQIQFVTEGDLYRLIASSKLPGAQRFESWVFDEILPSIRKRGGYMAPVAGETPEQVMARALLIANDTMERQRAEIGALRPKALVGEAVETSTASYTVSEAARYIAQINPSVRRQDLFDLLRGCEMMVKAGTAPTRAGIDTGRLVAVRQEYEAPDGMRHARQSGRLTGKGLAWAIERLCGKAVA